MLDCHDVLGLGNSSAPIPARLLREKERLSSLLMLKYNFSKVIEKEMLLLVSTI